MVVRLANTVDGRTISATFNVTFKSPAAATLGHTEHAVAIGRGLVREAMLLLQAAGEAEGFDVDVAVSLVVY